MTDPLNMEITLRRLAAAEPDCYEVNLRADIPGQDTQDEATVTARFDRTALTALLSNPSAYGLSLGSSFFAAPDLLVKFAAARRAAELAAGSPPVRLRLRIDPSAGELHALRWELMADPVSGKPLFTGDTLLFSRFLVGKSAALRPGPKARLRVLAAAAGPSNLAEFGMDPVDVPGELERAQENLPNIDVVTLPALAADGSATGRCSLNGLLDALRGVEEGFDALYLVCHGMLKNGMPSVALDDDTSGRTAWTSGADLAAALANLSRPPRLVVVTACEGAGDDTASALVALGPRLLAEGIPAVVAMQGKVKMKTVAEFMTTFFTELARDGVIDRAVAAARGAIQPRRTDWHAPVLFMRLTSGRLWLDLPVPELHSTSPTRIVPRQILAASEDFVGRKMELDALRTAIEVGKEPAVVVSGIGGMGKTAIALKLAEGLRDSFTGGDIQFDFGEVAIDQANSMDALNHILRSIQSSAQLPQNLPELAALYRSMLFDQKILILLDNVCDESQVQALLPPPRGCLIIITAMRKLAIPGLFNLELDELTDEDARAMLLDLAAPRLTDPDLALQLAAAAGKMPQAIEVIASLIQRRVDRTPQQLLQLMLNEQSDFALAGIDRPLEVSYQLAPRLQRPWRQLSVFSADFDADAAAWVWGMVNKDTPALFREAQVEGARELLGSILEQSLLRFESGSGRYKMYNPARIFAFRKMEPAERQAALRLHAGYYLNVLIQADDQYQRGGEASLEGLALFDRERREITAAQDWTANPAHDDREMLSLCNLYAAYGGYCKDLRFSPQEKQKWLEAGLRAARQLGEREFEAIHIGNLGIAIQEIKGPREALDCFKQQLAIAKEMGDERIMTNAHANIGVCLWKQGELNRAATQLRKSLKLARKLGDRGSEALAVGNLGIVYHDLKRSKEAIRFYKQQLSIAQSLGDLRQESNAHNNLGTEYGEIGDLTKAITHLQRSSDIYRRLDDRGGFGRTLDSLGTVYHKQGKLEEARAAFNDAIRYQREAFDRQGEAISCWNLGELLVELKDLPRAIELMQMAIDYELEIGHDAAVDHSKRLEEVKKLLP